MRFISVFLIASALCLGCKSQYATIDPSSIKTEEPANKNVQQIPSYREESVKVTDTKRGNDQKVVLREEQVVLKEGNSLKEFCIIVGSFINETNAVNLRASLVEQGFSESTILQNNQGMFRVSIACQSDEAMARAILKKIRTDYPQYKDAWLLRTKL